MTKKARVTQADLTRMAKVAKEFGVVVCQEIDGVSYCVGPAETETLSTLSRGPNAYQEWQDQRAKMLPSIGRKKKLPDDFRL